MKIGFVIWNPPTSTSHKMKMITNSTPMMSARCHVLTLVCHGPFGAFSSVTTVAGASGPLGPGTDGSEGGRDPVGNVRILFGVLRSVVVGDRPVGPDEREVLTACAQAKVRVELSTDPDPILARRKDDKILSRGDLGSGCPRPRKAPLP